MSTDPTQGGVFLTAAWRHLLMVNYEVDPDLVRPHVPAGTELDLWQGRCLVSLVGFLFLGTKVLGIPIPGHRNFEEVNLRFYVVREGPEGLRRGVVFVREIVPRRMIAWVARTLYGEPYVALPMRHEIDADDAGLVAGGKVAYGWRVESGWCRLEGRLGDDAAMPELGSEEEFITEHYWGYTGLAERTMEYRVEHPPWSVWPVRSARFDGEVGGLYGPEWTEPLSAEPVSAFVAEGSEILVRRGHAI